MFHNDFIKFYALNQRSVKGNSKAVLQKEFFTFKREHLDRCNICRKGILNIIKLKSY